ESTRPAAARMRRLLRPLESLPQLRAQIDEGRLSSPYRIVEAYSGLIEEVYRSLGNRDPEGEVATVPEIRAATSYVDSAEYQAREHALLAAALRAGSMSGAHRAAYLAALTARRDALAAALRDAGRYLRPAVDERTAGVPYKRLTQVEGRVLAGDGTGRPPAAAQW